MPRPPHAVAAMLLSLCAVAQDARPPELFQLGLGLQQRGLHEDAARQFAAFLEKDPKHALAAEGAYRCGVSLLALEQTGPALERLQQALRTGGAKFALRHECRYRLAMAQKDGDPQPAAALLTEMLADLPADHYLQAGARYALGECQRDVGDDKAALPSFQAAAKAAKGDAAAFAFAAHYQAGFAALRLSQPAVARDAFEAAVAATSDAAQQHECRFLAGDAALRAGDHDGAERWLEQARNGSGDFVDDSELALAFVAVARGNAEGALVRLQQLVQQRADSPLRPRAQLEIGRLSYQRQDYARAEKVLLPLKDDADAAIAGPARELLGLCALATGRGESAVEPLRHSLAAAADADKPRLSFALAEALAEAGKFQEALPCYEAAAQSRDATLRGDALYGACFALHRLARYDDSSAQAARLRKELPQHRLVPLATFAAAENLFAQKQYERAQKEYEAVPGACDSRPKADFKLAWCRYLLGDKKNAGDRFLAISSQKDHPHAEEALSMAALSLLEAEDPERAFAAADGYRARFPQGAWLDRTERVAARVLRGRGDLAGAATRLEHASKASKDGAQDQLEQAEVQFQRGDFAAAAAVYQPLCERNDALGARSLEGSAWCAFELGDDAACAQWLQKGLQHPQAATVEPALLELASALQHRQQDWKAAIATAQRFLSAHGKHAKAPAMRYALGVAQSRSGAHQEARRTLAALAQSGGYERMDRVHYELAWACRRSGDEPAALAAFAAVVEAAASTKDVDLAGEAGLHVGTAALQRGDEALAQKTLQAVQGRHRGRALYQLGFRDLEASEKKPELLARAEQSFAAVAAIEGEPLAPEAIFLVGECRRRAGDAAGAARQWQALLQRDEKHERAPSARLGLAEAAVQLGDGDIAVEQSQRFLAGAPKDAVEQARAHLAHGRGRQLRGENERAEAAFVKTTELSEGQLAAEAQFRIGECRAAAGNLQAAVDAFVKLPILYAHAEWVAKGLLQAGLCCERLKQPEKARRFFEELVQRFPASAEAKSARARLGQ